MNSKIVKRGKAHHRKAELLVLGADPTRDVRNFQQIREAIRRRVMRKAEELQASPSASR